MITEFKITETIEQKLWVIEVRIKDSLDQKTYVRFYATAPELELMKKALMKV
jgi:Uma2 family endonuclease